MLRCVLALILLTGLVAPAPPAAADWLSRLIVAGEKAGSRAARHGLSGLDSVGAALKALPTVPGKGPVLGAVVSQEGHWTLINRAGEKLTAASAEEVKRVANLLAPELATGNTRLTLVVGEDAIFSGRAALKELPAGAELKVAVGGEAHPLVRRGSSAGERLFAQVRPSLLVEASERKLFDEAVWQIARPLNKANVRVLSLEPGGPHVLSSAPRIDPTSRRALSDAIDPMKLAGALLGVRGQTVLLTGRIEGRLLHFRTIAGVEQSVIVEDLLKAAEAADVNLVVLRSASARQPGNRNWLWLKVEVADLDKALERASLADFLDALASRQGQMTVAAREQGQGRISLTVTPSAEGVRTLPTGGTLSDIVSELTGTLLTNGVEASMRSSERQQELDDRIVPGIPAGYQFAYLGGLVMGLLGLPFATAWFKRIWRPEQRADYGHGLGYQAARATRLLLFSLLFLPLAGPPAFLCQIAVQLWAIATAPFRALGWLARKLAGRTT
jgi:hypothetical protein